MVDDRPMNDHEAHRLAQPTLRAVLGPIGYDDYRRERHPGWVHALAATAVLRG
jgi:hypothetical protein